MEDIVVGLVRTRRNEVVVVVAVVVVGSVDDAVIIGGRVEVFDVVVVVKGF